MPPYPSLSIENFAGRLLYEISIDGSLGNIEAFPNELNI